MPLRIIQQSILHEPAGSTWIWGTTQWVIANCDPESKARLTTILVDQRNGGNENPCVDHRRVEWAEDGDNLLV